MWYTTPRACAPICGCAQKCDELDDTRFHQQELYDEWEKLAEEQETFENEGE